MQVTAACLCFTELGTSSHEERMDGGGLRLQIGFSCCAFFFITIVSNSAEAVARSFEFSAASQSNDKWPHTAYPISRE